MKTAAIETSLIDVLVSVIGERARALSAEDDLDLTSLEVVLLHEELEEKLGIRIPARDVHPDNFRTVARLQRLLGRPSSGESKVEP
ncbi:MAG: hypothetical protein KC416_00850 [Myxococcales bacterium]|nr:hypothetical protein [Myxococcales bacterium]